MGPHRSQNAHSNPQCLTYSLHYNLFCCELFSHFDRILTWHFAKSVENMKNEKLEKVNEEWEVGNGQRQMSQFLLGLFSFQADVTELSIAWPSCGQRVPLSILFLNFSKPVQLHHPFSYLLFAMPESPHSHSWRQKEKNSWKMACACENIHNSSHFNEFIFWLWLIRFAPPLWQMRRISLVSGSP